MGDHSVGNSRGRQTNRKITLTVRKLGSGGDGCSSRKGSKKNHKRFRRSRVRDSALLFKQVKRYLTPPDLEAPKSKLRRHKLKALDLELCLRLVKPEQYLKNCSQGVGERSNIQAYSWRPEARSR